MTSRLNQKFLKSDTCKSFSVFFVAIVLSACASNPAPLNSKKGVIRGADNALIHTQLARGYLQQKQYAVAKAELEEALKINPNHSDGNYVMGLLMMELEQYDIAERHFSKAVKADRSNSAAAHDFGMFLCQIGKERESIAYFEIAANNPLFANRELSYMRAGECLARLSDAGAEGYLKRALDVNPELRPALYRLATIKKDAHSYLSARAYIERYIAITKPQPGALLLAHQIELKLNARQFADQYRTQLLNQFPGSKQAESLRKKNNYD